MTEQEDLFARKLTATLTANLAISPTQASRLAHARALAMQSYRETFTQPAQVGRGMLGLSAAASTLRWLVLAVTLAAVSVTSMSSFDTSYPDFHYGIDGHQDNLPFDLSDDGGQ